MIRSDIRRGKRMIIREAIDKKLKEKLREKQQEVIRLRWQKSEIEKNLENLKRAAGESNPG